MAEKKPHKRVTTPVGSTAPLGDATGSPRRKLSLPFVGRSKDKGSVAPRRAANAGRRVKISAKGVAIAFAVILALFIAGTVGIVVLSHTDAFTIRSIDAQPTEHVTSDDIAALAGVEQGTTLLNYDEATIVQNLHRNPWIADVKISREFPDQLRVTVTERVVSAYVMMNSGSVIWCLGNDDVWIEPVKIEVTGEQSITEAAMAAAIQQGALLITDTPHTVNPVAGTLAEDEVFVALRTYRDELSEELWSQIVSFNLSSVEGISCMLQSGVEVSLGSPTSISSKETVIEQLLAKYPNRLTYINVRVPASPSYRMVETESVEGGTGAIGDVADVATVNAPATDETAMPDEATTTDETTTTEP